MGTESLEEIVHHAVAENAPVRPEDPCDLDLLALRDDLGFDSLTLALLVLSCEEKLGVELAGSGLDLGGVVTVADLVGLARKLVARTHSAE